MTELALLIIDGADLELIKEQVNKDQLPTFQKLLDQGRLKNIRSTIPSNTSPAAFSIYTGCNPAKNGPVAMTKRDGETPYSRGDLQKKQLWDYLDLANTSFLAYRPRFTAPVPAKGEVFVAGYPQTGNIEKDFYPSNISEELEKEDFPVGESTPEDVGELGEFYKKNLEKLERIEADFRLYYIGILDTVGHHNWDNESLEVAYQKVDEILANQLEKDRDVIILSDHGFHQAAEFRFHLNNLLEEEGYIQRKNTAKYLDTIIPLIKKNVPDTWIRPIWRKIKSNPEKSEEQEESFLSFEKRIPGVDWENTAAYCSNYFGIDVRDKDNIEEIIDLLEDTTFMGESVFEEIHRTSELYEGDYIGRLPEIVFVLNPRYRATHTFANNFFTERKDRDYGDHEYAINGIFGVSEGLEMPNVTPNLYDVAPTVLAFYGIELSQDHDGRILPLKEFSELKRLEDKITTGIDY